LILRWFWWRVNAYSEIAATITPFIIFGAIKLFNINVLYWFSGKWTNGLIEFGRL
jgi:hypothetical protein